MRPVIAALSVLLAAQIVLAAGVWWLGGSAGALPPQARLLAAKAEGIQTLTIVGAEGSTVVLERSDAGWRLPQAGGFPADAQRIEQIIAVLSEPLRGFPVARSQAARKRLTVAAQQYRRRLEFAGKNGALATVYLGNSAGTGEVYARAAGTQTMYKLGLGLSQASSELEDWYQSGAAALAAAKVQKAILPGFTLVRSEDGWRLGDGGARIDTAQAAQAVRRLATPAFESASKAQAPNEDPVLRYRLVTKDGDEVRFAYFAAGDGDSAILMRSDQPWRYRIDAEQLATLQAIQAKDLLAEAGNSEDAAAATKTSAAAGPSSEG